MVLHTQKQLLQAFVAACGVTHSVGKWRPLMHWASDIEPQSLIVFVYLKVPAMAKVALHELFLLKGVAHKFRGTYAEFIRNLFSELIITAIIAWWILVMFRDFAGHSPGIVWQCLRNMLWIYWQYLFWMSREQFEWSLDSSPAGASLEARVSAESVEWEV